MEEIKKVEVVEEKDEVGERLLSWWRWHQRRRRRR